MAHYLPSPFVGALAGLATWIMALSGCGAGSEEGTSSGASGAGAETGHHGSGASGNVAAGGSAAESSASAGSANAPSPGGAGGSAGTMESSSGAATSAGSTSTGGAAGSSGAGAGAFGTGGAAGSSGAGAGSFGTGGAAGSPSAGGVAGSAGFGGACRSASDCPPETHSPSWTVWSCVEPYTEPPPSYVSGVVPVVDWCGSTYCEPPPPGPVGSGTVCQGAGDCPAPSSGDPAASLCVDEACAECATNADCPVVRPACTHVGPYDASGYQACVECMTDAECTGAHPHCVVRTGLGGECKDCRLTSDCADGVCSATSFTCVPGCETASDCPDPANPCSSRHRCEPQDCTDSSSCPPRTTCQSGLCVRAPCSSDADCADGFCVEGRCHEDLGTCASQVRGA